MYKEQCKPREYWFSITERKTLDECNLLGIVVSLKVESVLLGNYFQTVLQLSFNSLEDANLYRLLGTLREDIGIVFKVPENA